MVNGHNAPPKVVENLFQSVQLNINNPHFLIMQGQITKVLNMKPPEILAMLEETAGTRMFEDRKLKALQTMDRKERKVEEIAGLLNDVIGPKLDGLRKEKSEFVEFKRTESDIERLVKFLAAFDFFKCTQLKEKGEIELEQKKEEITELDEEIKDNRLEMEQLSDKIMVTQKKKEKESKASYKLKELEVALKESENELIKLQTQVDITRESVSDTEKEIEGLEARLKKEEKCLEKEEKGYLVMKEDLEKKEQSFESLKSSLFQQEELLRSLSTGISSSGQATGYEKFVDETQNKINAATIKIQQSEMKIKSLEESLSTMKTEVAKAKKDSTGSTKKIDSLKAEITALEEEKSSITFDVNHEKLLEEERRRLEAELDRLCERLDNLKGQVQSVKFTFSDPYPGFDRSQVKGTVAELVTLPESSTRYSHALEIAAGGRLYNVVVDNEEVASNLLEKGKLTRRVTIIPLNKIVAKTVPSEKCRLAADLSKGKATIGLSLVIAESNVMNAIEYVFGSAFICEDKDAACTVAFDSRIGCKAVTVDGDVYEPSGTLSGGSSASGSSILSRLCEYNKLRSEYDRLEKTLRQKRESLESLRVTRRMFADMEQRGDLKKHELLLVERQMSQNATGRLIQQYESMLAEVSSLTETISESLQVKAEAETELGRLQSEMVEFSSNRDGKLKALEKEVQTGKKTLLKETEQFEVLSNKFMTFQSDLDVLKSTISGMKSEIEVLYQNRSKLGEDLASLQSTYFEQQSITVGLRVKYETEVQHLRQFDEELRILEMHRQQLTDTLEQSQMDRKELVKSIESITDQVGQTRNNLSSLLSQHPWIKDQQRLFGAADGPFDFSTKDISQSRKQLTALQEQHNKLRKNINFNVMDMIDRYTNGFLFLFI